MHFNRHLLRTSLYVLGTSAFGALFLWSLGQDHLIIARLIIGLIWLVLLVALIFYIDRANKTLIHFISSIGHLESYRHPLPVNQTSLRKLQMVTSSLSEYIREVRSEKEKEYLYFNSIVNSVETGIISYDQKGNINLMNPKAESLLKMSNPGSMQRIREQYPLLEKVESPKNQRFSSLCRLPVQEETLNLSVKQMQIKTPEGRYTILTLNNINSEMQEQEMMAWRDLLAVLTHEIMNSVSPVSSLSNSLLKLLESEPANETGKNDAFATGLKAIQNRSKGLLQFVEAYQKLSKVPNPVKRSIPLKPFFSDLELLMKEELQKHQISLKIKIQPEELNLEADEQLLTQVLINLIQNAVYALAEKPDQKLISLEADRTEEKEIQIRVSDNGKGIPADIKNSIFIPFFTSRKNGSGIGLSLARQIMYLHKGSIQAFSEEGKDTCFTLLFPA